MHKIKNKSRLALGLITNILSITCFIFAFRQKGIVEEISSSIDDHNRIIAMKSCQTAMQFLNYILLGATLFSLVLYGAFKISAFLVVAITLCSVLVLMFIITLVTNKRLSHP